MTALEEFMTEPTPTRWGRWSFTPDRKALRILDGTMERYVDLSRCATDADRWFWTRQYAGKAWVTPDDVRDLVTALDQIAGAA